MEALSVSAFQQGKADADTLRVLVATDNHLGYMEEDSVRGDDSFTAFEEILMTARQCNVDCIILAGDLFHINRPTRATMTRTMNLFRKYCMGERDVDLVVRGTFAHESGLVNFEDENVAIDLPVFAIHGNHDGRTREGAMLRSLSALDLLSEARLINYFGFTETVEGLVLEPVQIEKGLAKLRLYGMGWVRDERLHHLFEADKVKFRTVKGGDGEEGEEMRAWYNMMLVHQNREQKGRGTKNCFREAFIPDFMDLVVFGHEHECIIEPQEMLTNENCLLSQPGSSVRTSLSDTEQEPKHIAILEIKLDPQDVAPVLSSFTKIPLRTLRPFKFEEIALSSHAEELMGSAKELLEQTENLLARHVTRMIKEAREEYRQARPDLREEEAKRMLPLVRLRVEYAGYQPINSQRFAARFASKVANPGDILQWYKKRAAAARSERPGGDIVDVEDLANELQNRMPAEEVISALVEGVLSQTKEPLSLLAEAELNQSIRGFVDNTGSAKSIELFLDEYLESRQQKLLDDDDVDADKLDDVASKMLTDKNARNKELAAKARAAERVKERAEAAKAQAKAQARALRGDVGGDDEDDGDDDDDDDDGELIRFGAPAAPAADSDEETAPRKRARTATSSRGRAKAGESASRSPPTRAARGRGRGAAASSSSRRRTAASRNDDGDDDDDEAGDDEDDENVRKAAEMNAADDDSEFEEPAKPRQKSVGRRTGKPAPAKRGKAAAPTAVSGRRSTASRTQGSNRVTMGTPFDEDSLSEAEDVLSRPSSAPATKRPARQAAPKRSFLDDNDDDDSDEPEIIDPPSAPAPRTSSKRVAQAPLAKAPPVEPKRPRRAATTKGRRAAFTSDSD